MKIDIVIPAYNEEKNIKELFTRLIYTSRRLNLEVRFLFVIQGSYEAVEEINKVQNEEKINKIKVLYFKQPLGIGRAFKKGFENISDDCDYVLTMDADLNHQPEELDRFMYAIKEADIVVGSRYIRRGKIFGMPLWKIILSRLVNEFLSLFVKIKIKDKTSGYRLMRREVVRKIIPKLEALNFDFYVEFLVRAFLKKFKIKEVPITFIQRKYGYSKMKKMNTFLSYIKLLLRIRRLLKKTAKFKRGRIGS